MANLPAWFFDELQVGVSRNIGEDDRSLRDRLARRRLREVLVKFGIKAGASLGTVTVNGKVYEIIDEYAGSVVRIG